MAKSLQSYTNQGAVALVFHYLLRPSPFARAFELGRAGELV